MYKSDGMGIELDRLSINFKGDVTYEIKEELKSFLNTKQENIDYTVLIEVKEEMVPVIINENGTVSKYQIDITLFYEVTDKIGEVIISDEAVGFAQYDVTESEIINEETRKHMTRIATKNAIQIMASRIQSIISR